MKKTAHSAGPAAAPARRPSLLAQAPDPEPAVGLGAAALLYFGLALLYFLPAFLPGRHIFGTDYLQAGYFFYDFVKERTAAGSLPGWVPYVYGGLPHYANPGSTYHPFLMLADLTLPVARFLPFLFWLQFGFAGLGMYLLARELGCRAWVAVVIGLAFQWTGITTSWVYAGHDGRIIVTTSMPLFFYFLHRGVRTGRFAPFAGLAATTAFILLSFQIQNAYYLLLAGALWAVFALVKLGVHRRPPLLAKTVALGLGAIAFGFLTAAVDFLPFQSYVGQSPRGQTGGRGYEFSTSFSMPPRAILGVAVPEQVGSSIQDPETGESPFPVYRGQNGFRLHTEYLGATVLVLVALGAYYARRSRYVWFFAGLGFFFLTLAQGGNTPLYRLYYEVLPGLKRFRAPDLAYFPLAFALVVIAALALERLAEVRAAAHARRGSDADPDRPGRVLPIVGGVVGVAVLGALFVGTGSAAMAEGTAGLTPAQGWMRFAVFAAAAGAVLWLWTEGRMTSKVALVALSLVTVADLWIIGKRFFYTVPAPEEMFAEDDVTSFLKTQGGPDRVWPVPGMTGWPRGIDYPMLYDLEQPGGEHGNQLQRYNEYVGPGERTYVDYHNLIQDRRFLDAANVRWLVTSQPVGDPGLREAFRGSALVYENTSARPRAWLVGAVIPVASPDATLPAMKSTAWDPARNAVVETTRDLGLPATPLQGDARVIDYGPDGVGVRTRANRAALLVVADNFYEGWTAAVDGRPAEILRTNHTFRGVVVPAGEHTVQFTFRPRDLYTGFYIYVACLSLLAAYGVFLLARLRRRRRELSVDGAPADAPAPA